MERNHRKPPCNMPKISQVLKKSCRQYSKKSVCLVSHCIIKSICFARLCIIASVFRTQVIYFNTLHSAHLPIFLAAPRKTASYPPAIREAREGCRRDRTAEVLLCAARLKIMLRWKRGSPALVAHNGQIIQKYSGSPSIYSFEGSPVDVN